MPKGLPIQHLAPLWYSIPEARWLVELRLGGQPTDHITWLCPKIGCPQIPWWIIICPIELPWIMAGTPFSPCFQTQPILVWPKKVYEKDAYPALINYIPITPHKYNITKTRNLLSRNTFATWLINFLTRDVWSDTKYIYIAIISVVDACFNAHQHHEDSTGAPSVRTWVGRTPA
jgi:hypothetical protein